MDILGIGPLELLFILVIALIVVGPKDLARVGRALGRTLNRIYRSDSWRVLNEASQTIRTLPNRLAREAALEELDSVKDDVDKTREQLASDAKDFNQSLQAWTQPAGNHQEDEPESAESSSGKAGEAD